MKNSLLFSLVVVAANVAQAQLSTGSKPLPNSSHVTVTLFEDNKDGSVYTGMYEILKGIQPVSYVGAANFKGLQRPYPLREGEGKNGYLFEANLDQVFTLLQGRLGANHFWQRGRLAIRYAPALRMANDSSLPLVPTSQKIGFDYAFAIWNNYTRKIYLDQMRCFMQKMLIG